MENGDFKQASEPKRYIVVLDSLQQANIESAANELEIDLVDSSALSRKNPSFELLANNKGVFYKNLNMAVVNEIPEEKLEAAVASNSSPVIHWEEDKEFYAIDLELDKIEELKSQVSQITQILGELEQLIKNSNDDVLWDIATWGLQAINMQRAKHTGKGVNVCILDTGLYLDHPDFRDREIIGRSFVQGEDWDKDANGHGTHCAGTAIGNTDANKSRYGVAKDANLYIGKVLANSGSGRTSNIIDAIDWALEKGCQVISMSLGSPVNLGENPSLVFEQVGESCLRQNCLLIAAAGNDSRRPNQVQPVSSPANCNSVMAVGALDNNNHVAYFSNAGLNSGTGGAVDICAPGVRIYSTLSQLNGQNALYGEKSGTSMATPHVAGIAALFWEAFPNESAQGIWQKLINTTKPIDGSRPRDVGHGLAQAI